MVFEAPSSIAVRPSLKRVLQIRITSLLNSALAFYPYTKVIKSYITRIYVVSIVSYYSYSGL